MELQRTCSLLPPTLFPPSFSIAAPSTTTAPHPIRRRRRRLAITCAVVPDPWTPRDGSHLDNLKPRHKNPKNPLSDDNARRIIKARARYLSTLRRNQGSAVQTPRWIRRSPEQMVQYLEDDRNGHIYGKHVVAAVRTVRALSQRPEGSYDMRRAMSSFVAKLTFREMCVVLKEQKSWRQVRDFFDWMKLQLCYHPSVIAYTIVLRAYGQVGKIKLSEETFLEMLDAGCEPDEVACGTMLCTYAKWGRHNSMLSFYSAVQQRGVLLQLAVYNFMLSSLQKKSRHTDVVQVWRDMASKGVAPNHFTLTVVICSLAKVGLFKEAIEAFNHMKSLDFVPEEVTYCLLITLCVKEGQKDEALRLYGDMRSLGKTPSNFTCASLLTLYFRTGDYSKALSLFSEMVENKIPADEVICGIMIRIYGKLGLFEDAEKTFELAADWGLLTDEKTYIAMAHVHLRSGNYMKALNVMEQMRARDMWYSRYAYIVLLKCYVLKGDLESAEHAFKSLLKTGLPDANCCNDMLKMYMTLKSWEKAKDFILQIRRDKVEFDDELCRTVMKLYTRGGMLTEVEQFLAEIKSSRSFRNNNFTRTIEKALHLNTSKVKGVKGSLSVLDTDAVALMLNLHLANSDELKIGNTLRLLLSTDEGSLIANQLLGKFFREGDIEKGEAINEHLMRLGAKLDDTTMASIITLYGRQQNLKRAREMFEEWEKVSSLGAQTYRSMIDACTKIGEIVDAYNIYIEAMHKGIDVGVVTISMLVNNLIIKYKYHEAEYVINSCFNNNQQLDTIAYNTFVKAMMEAGKLHFATTIYERMISTGNFPSIQTYNTMMSVYARRRNIDKAVEMFNLAEKLDVSLDERIYTNMISIYGKAGKIHEASLLFSKMQKEGIQPGEISYNVYAAAGILEKAEEIFHGKPLIL
ncbi:hypothetical protein V2J09_008500 [Rumex salicifolius]